MSKFGMKIGGETVYNIAAPDQALELVNKVVEQYFGEYWTQHKPRCPLCDEALLDTEKYMNRPVGECSSDSCDSTIHIADFLGKIKDVLEEWNLVKEDWMEKLKIEIRKKDAIEKQKTKTIGFSHAAHTPITLGQGLGGTADTEPGVLLSDDENSTALTLVDEDTVFIW